ncbi:MAG: hypothetical protein ABSA58_02275 [Acetobacteraceae bacterium]
MGPAFFEATRAPTGICFATGLVELFGAARFATDCFEIAVFAPTVFAPTFFAPTFFALAFLATAPVATALVVWVVRAVTFPDRTALRAVTLEVVAFAFFGFAVTSFGRETFTSPLMGRLDDDAFAAVAFTFGRPVDLLRGVEAMGSTLGAVETRLTGQ